MIDKKKVINGLRCCLHDEDNDHGRLCEECPYDRGDCRKDLYNDTLELLKDLMKEQESVKPKLVGVNMWRCGSCDALLGWENFSQSGLELINYKYCPGCGRRVKWDD